MQQQMQLRQSHAAAVAAAAIGCSGYGLPTVATFSVALIFNIHK